MYDVTGKSNEQLVEEVCRRLNENGLRDVGVFGDELEFTTDDGFCKGLLYLPRENLIRMVQCPIDDWSDLGKVYNAWGRAGALRFEPYVVDEDTNPSLVVRHDRYIHMFRGYHFQASGTIDGIGDCGSGSYRIDFLTNGGRHGGVIKDSLLSYMLWWASFIDVGFRFDNFVKLFNSKRDVLEHFLNLTIKYCGGPSSYRWDDIENHIEIGDGNIDIYNRKMYQLQSEGNGVDAYMAIGYNSVQVETVDNKLVTIHIPEPGFGTSYNFESELDSDDWTEYDRECLMLADYHFREILLVMAAKLAGIDINFIGYRFLHPSKDRKRMKPINRPEVVIVKSLNEIYKAEPDNY